MKKWSVRSYKTKAEKNGSYVGKYEKILTLCAVARDFIF